MKLICLNLWGGRIREPLLDFIRRHEDVDVFCFQEIYNKAKTSMAPIKVEPDLRLLETLEATLPHHTAFFEPVILDVFGIGMFVKNTHKISDQGAILLYENPNYAMFGGDHDTKMQWVRMGPLTIMNARGLYTGTGKGDTPTRIEQSRRIRTFMDSVKGPKILCGDFNLRPDTESFRMLEEGMIDLVTLHHIPTTRPPIYKGVEKFADYILVSPDIKVIEFKVLQDEVSDHLPLYLEFEYV